MAMGGLGRGSMVRATRRLGRERGVAVAAAALALGLIAVTPAASAVGTTHSEATTGWSAVASPSPSGFAITFSGVSCVTSGWCMAVGSYRDSNDSPQVLAEEWNGASWSVVPVSSGGELNSVSCPTTTDCTAVGQASDSVDALVERWNGSSWSEVANPSPPPATTTTDVSGTTSSSTSYLLQSVSCVSASFCMATGQSFTSSSFTPANSPGEQLFGNQVSSLAEKWDGASWQVVGSSGADLAAVSCLSSSWCMAVGAGAEEWNGSSWSPLTTPSTASTTDQLNGLSCVSSSDCLAVGSSGAADGSSTTLSERWNGSSWTVEATPDPNTTNNNYLTGVSCVSSSFCIGVGGTGSGSIIGPNITAVWNGSTWAEQPNPTVNPDPFSVGDVQIGLAGVSCPSALSCTAVGARESGTLVEVFTGSTPTLPPLPPSHVSVPRAGYDLFASDGGVFTFGNTSFHGSTGGVQLAAPIVGASFDSVTGGYWLAASDGGIFAFDAPFHGSAGSDHLAQPVVAIAATPDGKGYWLAARDGGVFSYGDARFYGSMGAQSLASPIVAITSSRDGKGYLLVASDGGVFAFGDAKFHGSTGGVRLAQPIVGAAPDPSTGGYWLVASDGGVFGFDAPFRGSTGGVRLARPIVGMGVDPLTGGYWLTASDGGVFAFGAPFYGSVGGDKLDKPVVGIAAG
jgi:hypothetical protein